MRRNPATVGGWAPATLLPVKELPDQVPSKSATAKKVLAPAEPVKAKAPQVETAPVEAPPSPPLPEGLAEPPLPDLPAAVPVEDTVLPAPAARADDEDEEEDDPAPTPGARPNHGHHMMGRNQAIAPGGRVMPPPRAMAKAEIFEEGDHVVYPTHGVGKVERIATEEIAGHKLELIHITFEENRMTLRVPVAKARTAGLRKLATRKMFDEAMTVLRGRARIKRTMWSRRAQEYEAKINSGDPLAIAEVVRDLHRNAGQPDQSFSERQIYEAAMDRLAAELGALERIDKAAAATKLAEFLKTVV